jgi:hypothetical protein
MSNTIRIPASLYKRLERHAEGFDTPANVIKRLLDYYEGVEDAVSEDGPLYDFQAGKDYTKFSFNNNAYGKGRLVHAVVKEYAVRNPEVSLDKLQKVFPDELQGSIGVVASKEDALKIYEQTGHKRHFIKPDEFIQLQDCVIAVSREWGKGNINNFITHAQSLGFDIQPVQG